MRLTCILSPAIDFCQHHIRCVEINRLHDGLDGRYFGLSEPAASVSLRAKRKLNQLLTIRNRTLAAKARNLFTRRQSLAGLMKEFASPQKLAHLVVGKRDGTAHGGHLLQAHVRPTCELVLTESPAQLKKEFDSAAGIPLIRL